MTTYLQNTENGVVTEHTDEQAEQYLEHPVFGQYLKVVRTGKNEVLVHDGLDAVVIETVEDAPAPRKSTSKNEDK